MVPVILGVILQVLALFMIRKLTGSFVGSLQAQLKSACVQPKSGCSQRKFFALHTHSIKNPPSQYPVSAPAGKDWDAPSTIFNP